MAWCSASAWSARTRREAGHGRLACRLADLAEDLHGQSRALWIAAPSQRPLEMLRRVGELLGRTDLQADTGYEEQAQPERPPI
jgi:hypothetical protein